MDQTQRSQWIDEVIQQVLAAVAHDLQLRQAIVFKGAWILNAHLKDNRHSMDIDANTSVEWAMATPGLEKQQAFFELNIQNAVNRHFERQDPVRFAVTQTSVKKSPPKEHPRTWTAFKVKLTVTDAVHVNVRGLPAIEMDIAAPEELGDGAVEIIDLLGAPAKVYSLHRIAGEKLRAYLTSLPTYRVKMGGGERSFRAKDLYDLARILRAKPLADEVFWAKASDEFRLACTSRLVDCAGLDSFKEAWHQARATYEADPTLWGISFDESARAIEKIARFLETRGVFPLNFPLTS